MALLSDNRRLDRSSSTDRTASELDEHQEVELSSLLDLQDQRQHQQSRSVNRVLWRGAGATLVLACLWYAVSADTRRSVNQLIRNIQQSREDFRHGSRPDSMSSGFDQLIDQFGAHAVQIDSATRSLGVDPATVEDDGMDAEIQGMMGEAGVAAAQRERLIMGAARVAGVDLPGAKPPVAEEPSAPSVDAGRPPVGADAMPSE